jgi:hypothetical protein
MNANYSKSSELATDAGFFLLSTAPHRTSIKKSLKKTHHSADTTIETVPFTIWPCEDTI